MDEANDWGRLREVSRNPRGGLALGPKPTEPTMGTGELSHRERRARMALVPLTTFSGSMATLPS